MTAGEWIRSLRDRLAGVSGPCALQEAERILMWALSCSRSALYLAAGAPLTRPQEDRVESVVRRRLTGEPLAYATGECFFHSVRIEVTRTVLIPRPETEILADAVLETEPDRALTFADIGTGSGCIAAALCRARPLWRAVAADISPPALRIARRNATGAACVCADMLSAFKPVARFDFLVANPPYVTDAEMEELDGQVRGFEPEIALAGGPDGLDFYRIIARAGRPLLRGRGRIYCEFGVSQKDAVSSIFAVEGWSAVSVRPDLAGRPRVMIAAARE